LILLNLIKLSQPLAIWALNESTKRALTIFHCKHTKNKILNLAILLISCNLFSKLFRSNILVLVQFFSASSWLFWDLSALCYFFYFVRLFLVLLHLFCEETKASNCKIFLSIKRCPIRGTRSENIVFIIILRYHIVSSLKFCTYILCTSKFHSSLQVACLIKRYNRLFHINCSFDNYFLIEFS
jgi:hypothetical protein